MQGLTERPALNYRTLSDSVWNVNAEAKHPWQGNNPGAWHPIFGDFRLRSYGPELFMSGNTTEPYGQNDGVLWQGRGFNALLKGGARFEGYGVELTLLPHFAFSQNAPFDIMKPEMSGPEYEGKADTYGYFWNRVDAPQCFGDKAFFDWDFGDSEIRYTWRTLTAGFGTQAIWLGPSYLNSMLHSNNAPAYPKFDIGLRRQRVTIPWVNWYIGDIEARLWVGQLTESYYFDNDVTNDHTMIHGFTFAYAPSFLPGLTLFANRVCLVPWAWENLKFILPKDENTIEDQKSSFGVSWVFPQAGVEVYGELGIDDFIPNGFSFPPKFTHGYIRYPFHTMMYTAGFKKVISVRPDRDVYGELFFEWNSMEMSQDFQFQWPYSPYFHYPIIHGYTNKGQWLGAGTGWGGNSQYLGFKLYYPKGSSTIFMHRNNPDNNYIYSKAVYASASRELEENFFTAFKANLAVGIDTRYFITNAFILGGGLIYNFIVNPQYYFTKTDNWVDVLVHTFSFQLTVKYQF